MGDSNATSPKPSGGSAPDQNGPNVKQHHRLAQGYKPPVTGPKTPA